MPALLVTTPYVHNFVLQRWGYLKFSGVFINE